MERHSNGFGREVDASLGFQNSYKWRDNQHDGWKLFTDITQVKEENNSYTRGHRKLSQESFEEDFSEYSFYDLPETLRDSLHKSMHLSDLVISPHAVSPSPHTTEVRHMHAYVDPDVKVFSPYSTPMGDTGNPTTVPLSSKSHSFHNGKVSLKSQLPTFQKQSVPILQDKASSGPYPTPVAVESLYGLSERSKGVFGDRPSPGMASQSPVYNPVCDATKTHSVLVKSASSRQTNHSRSEQVQRSTVITGSRLSCDDKEDVLGGNDGDIFCKGSAKRKDHSAKSVSFSNHVERNGPSLYYKEEELESVSRPGRAAMGAHTSLRTPTSSSRQWQVQSNMKKFQSPATSDQAFQKRSVLQSEISSSNCKDAHGLISVSGLPQSPPTRDKSDSFVEHRHLGHNMDSVQILSLYDDSISQGSAKNPHIQIQSNLNVNGTSRKDSVYHEHAPTRPRQSNVKLDHASNGILGSCRNDSVKASEVFSSPLSGSRLPSKDGTLGELSSMLPGQQKEHAVDNLFEELSLTKSFSVETSKRISTAMWAMKLMDAAHSTNPTAYQETMMKARLFRRWFQRARLRRSLRHEEDKKLERADTFWHTETLNKFFTAWANTQAVDRQRAKSLCNKHILQKGLRGLRVAVCQHRQVVADFHAKSRGRLMAKYWLKWQRYVKQKENERLRSAFNKWQMFKLEAGRDKILESMANRYVLSKNYIRWKSKYSVEQRNGVASLHYKICLLTKCWHAWRMYTAQMVVKQRLCEVARVHYEEHLQLRVFQLWRESAVKLAVAGNLKNRRSVCQAFHSWRNWTQYAKIIHLRFQSMCKEYRHRKIIKQTFIKWRVKLMRKRADVFSSHNLQRRTFKLWFLRHRRKVIHRHLRKAMARKGMKRRYFRKWLNFTREQKDTRIKFILSLEQSLAAAMFNKWKEYSLMKASLRDRLNRLTRKRNFESCRRTMDQFLFAMKVAHFRKQVQINWSRRCTRKACEAWKLLLKRKYLEQRLIDSRPMWELIRMRKVMKKWRSEKTKLDEEKLKAARVSAILSRNYKARVLQAWRVVNQEEHIIASLLARRKRKEMAKMFDAWRLRVYRQKYIVDQKTRTTEKILDKYFLNWRERAYLKVKERELTEKLLEGQQARAFRAWRALVKDQRHERLRRRAHKLQLMQKFYTIWKTNCQQKIEEKDEKEGYKRRCEVLLVWTFKWWKQAACHQRQKLIIAEETSSAHLRQATTRAAFHVWLRRYRSEEKAREHIRYRKNELLRKCLLALRTYARETIQWQVMEFHTLSLDSSAGSALMRSGHGSTFSDTLSSSGYGASFRRGSQPVFRVNNALSDEDDVSSLPGILDQLRPESPQMRPTSPISILRESRPMMPRAFSPSPCGSISPERQTPDLLFGRNCNGFSPVKSEDETAIPSGSSESDHEDDRMSVLSFSTTGRSTQSEAFDRGIILTDTIRHWRSLPLSLTFRSWLKYTRHMKLLKDRMYYAQEKKQTEMIQKTLQTWRRELYTKVAARQHWLDKTRLICLRAWHEFTENQRKQEKRKVQGENQWRKYRLSLYFKKWSKKCSSHQKLQELVKQWQTRATVSQKDKTSTEALQKKQGSRIVRQKFLIWVQMTKKSEEARRHYLEGLTPRCFAAWHVLVSSRLTNRKKVVLFEEHRLLTSAFREWLARFAALRKAEEFVEIRETDHLVEILRSWHTWANGMTTRRNQARLFRRSVELKKMRGIFSVWLTEARDLGRAKRHYQHGALRRVVHQWKNVIYKQAVNNQNVQTFRQHQSSNLLLRCFQFWQRLHAHCELARARAQELEQNLLKECLNEWRNFALNRRAQKHHIRRLCRKMLFSWYEQYISRKTTRRLLVTWKSRTDETKCLNTRAVQICRESEKQLMRRTFNRWIQEVHKVQKAKVHHTMTTKRSVLLSLHVLVHTRMAQRRTLVEVQEKKATQQLSRSFHLWKEYFQRNMTNVDILEVFLVKKDTDLLRVNLLRWKRYTHKCRAQKFCERQLVHKTFSNWWTALYRRNGTRKVLEKMLHRKTRQAAMHWRRWTVRVKKQAVIASDLQAQHGQRLLHAYFSRWVSGTDAIRQAREHHRKTVLRRSLSGWLSHVKQRTEERKNVKAFQDQRMQRNVAQMFRNWHSSLKIWQKHKQLINSQIRNHNQRVLKGATKEWRKYTLKNRAEKHFNTFLKVKVFLDWKIKFEERQQEKEKLQELEYIAIRYHRLTLCKMCFRAWSNDVKVERYQRIKEQRVLTRCFIVWKKKVTLNSIAGDLSERRLYEIYWTKWRHQLIRKRVSELMFKHEQKKLVSEVFGAWYHMTVVRRRLLKEWNVYKTMKLFRKWMRKYNDS